MLVSFLTSSQSHKNANPPRFPSPEGVMIRQG